jgi:CDP-diacylglycerol--glycerol-3-phosphate 3-phosphatidyltransferase/cardiolipin synthase
MVGVAAARDAGGPEPPDFVLDLLAELRRGGYRPAGWRRFFARSWAQARATARAHPALVRSWRRTAAGLALAEAGTLALEARLGAGETARQAALPAVAAYAYAQLDAYVHLGLHAPARGAPLHEDFSLPNTLTQARRALAGLLWAHLWTGRPASQPLAAAALLAAGVTDVADGQLARRTGRVSRLGHYLDATADCSFALALGLTLVQRRTLPRWLAALLLARWSVPLAYALNTYFVGIRRAPLGTTWAGKAAGIAQAAALGAALLPTRVLEGRAGARAALHAMTALLLVAAPLAQLRRAARRG